MATARTLPTFTAPALLAAALLLGAATAATPTTAEAATAAAGCSGVTLSPASRTVKRGGQVLLEGRACGASYASPASSGAVQLKIRKGKRWASLPSAQADEDGTFSVCARVSVPRNVKVARVQATASGITGNTTVRVANKGTSSCSTGSGPSTDSGGSGGSGEGGYQPPPPEQGNADCPLSQPNSTIGLALPSSCTEVASDTASNPDPTYFWDRIECQDPTRHQQVTSGGDTHSTGLGSAQGNSAFRRLTVIDGDDFSGERCELGHNNMNAPTAFYHEGQRRVTFMSIRMPNSSPISDPRWRNVMQMKQAQPYTNPNPASIFEMQVRDSRWEVGSNWEGVWSTPATQNTWTRFAFDIVYSANPAVGSIKIYVDLNGDGDASDANEQSPRVFKDTLRVETSPAHPDGVGAGNSIPNHLRAGIYQDSSYSCPSGCSVDIDNVQVVKP